MAVFNAGKQKRTFLPYMRGIDPEALRIGSLFLDPLNPDDGLESLRFDYRPELQQSDYEERIKKYSWREQPDPRGCSISFTVASNSSFAVDFSSWVSAGADSDTSIALTLEGDSGRRLKLRTPEKFLREEVMTQPDIESWLCTHASSTRRGMFGYHQFKAPPIWLVTGVQLVTGGNVDAGSARSKHAHVGAGGDASLPLGLPSGTASAKVEAGVGSEAEAKNDHGFDEEQVWAAQFMQVSIEYGDRTPGTMNTGATKTSGDKPLPTVIKRFDLKPVPELKAGGLRDPRPGQSQDLAAAALKTPAPVAHVVADTTAELEDEDIMQQDDPEGIVVDEHPYQAAVGDVDWEMHHKVLEYLSSAKPRGSPCIP